MKKIYLIILLFVILVALGGYLYFAIISAGFNIEKPVYIKIDENKDYESVKRQLKDSAHIHSIDKFTFIAKLFSYPNNIKSGRYKITPDMNIVEALHILKSGEQTPVRLTFNNMRLKSDLTKRLSDQLMLTDSQLETALNDSAVCQKYGFNTATIVSMFIPNTYEIYWDTPLDKYLNKMQTEYSKFWNDKRKEKAANLNLSPIEVSILASIVEEECYFSDEYPIVAGLYMNRMRKDMLLQADPTVKFAVGDFSLKRILHKHLETNSPYNTYRVKGLPPGPIRIPSIKAIDGVLNLKESNYLYMCAKEDFSGRHNFAVTHAEHARNAARYRAALNKEKIY